MFAIIFDVAVRQSTHRLKSLRRILRVSWAFEILFEFRKAASADRYHREKLMGRLEGKSVIITGAGSGIGRAASVLFSKEGAKLILSLIHI